MGHRLRLCRSNRSLLSQSLSWTVSHRVTPRRKMICHRQQRYCRSSRMHYQTAADLTNAFTLLNPLSTNANVFAKAGQAVSRTLFKKRFPARSQMSHQLLFRALSDSGPVTDSSAVSSPVSSAAPSVAPTALPSAAQRAVPVADSSAVSSPVSSAAPSVAPTTLPSAAQRGVPIAD